MTQFLEFFRAGASGACLWETIRSVARLRTARCLRASGQRLTFANGIQQDQSARALAHIFAESGK